MKTPIPHPFPEEEKGELEPPSPKGRGLGGVVTRDESGRARVLANGVSVFLPLPISRFHDLPAFHAAGIYFSSLGACHLIQVMPQQGARVTISFSQGKPKQGVVARLCSPLGQYPTGCFGTSDEGYLFSDDAVLTAVRYTQLQRSDDYYSEVEWAEPHEIRLFASLALARESGEGAIIIYPLPLAYYPNLNETVVLGDASLLEDLKQALISEIKRTRRRNSWYYRALVGPPFISRRRYNDCGRGFAQPRYEQLLAAIQLDDYLVVRALSTWIRSSMLACHYQFIEEAITTLFISMEASFRLVLRRLRELGNPEPNSRDAAQFVGQAFNEAPLDHYLQEYYESRIKTFHPESRFGIYPHAPLMVDDFYHLHESLRDLYVYLLIGYVDPEYLERPRLGIAA